MSDPNRIYRLLIEAAAEKSAIVKRFQLGLTWSTCLVNVDGRESLGFAMSPAEKSRLIQWPGTVAGTPTAQLSDKLLSWNPFDATLALACCNAVINGADNSLLAGAKTTTTRSYANLAAFDFFRPKLANQKIVVVGRYPNLDKALAGLDVTILERAPEGTDLPDPAAEYLIPQADWVFLTATSLINKTFTRLCELAQNSVTVLMGPSTPWLPQLADWHIDFVAGVKVTDQHKAEQIAAEGGGTRLFEGGVQYAVAYLGSAREQRLKDKIAEVFAARANLKSAMEMWYSAGNQTRFPDFEKLTALDEEIATLDIAFKRLWDAKNLSKTFFHDFDCQKSDGAGDLSDLRFSE